MHGIAQRPDAALTLSSYLETWLVEHTAHLKPTTASNYRSRVTSVQQSPVADKRLRSLTETDYRRLVTDLAAQAPSHTTLTLKIGTLSGALNAAVRAGLIPNHPLGQIKVSRTGERFEPKAWSLPNVTKFLMHRRLAKDPLATIWHLAVVTGLRRGELHGLRQDDIDLDRCVLHVRRQRVEVRGKVIEQAPKTLASEAPVFLDAATCALLRDRTWTCEYLVADPRTGRPYVSLSTFGRDWRVACVNANVPVIRFHDLRHTSASMLAAAGVPLVLAQQRLRHWSPAMTARYTHALDGMGSQVADQIGALLSGGQVSTDNAEDPEMQDPEYRAGYEAAMRAPLRFPGTR